MANKIIISCAITGSIHTPTMSDALPITPDQIATQAIDAANAGAAILHLHARDPKDGRPSPDGRARGFREVVGHPREGGSGRRIDFNPASGPSGCGAAW